MSSTSPAAKISDGPSYEQPPVVETVLGVQFDRLPSLKNAQVGAFWKSLDTSEWPTIVDAPPLPPQSEVFTKAAKWAKGIQLQLSQDSSSRLQIKSKDDDRMIQVQNGRLHFNWLGKGGDKYPRYEKVREGFVSTLERFIDFLAEENIGDFQPNQWEVTYVNHIPQGTVWKTPDDWGFFRPLGSLPTIENLVDGESFSGEWHFVIPGQRGRLHVHWQHALGSTSDEEDREYVRLTFTARGPMQQSENDIAAVLDGLDLGRETIVRSFEKLMSDDANQYWGLKHATS